MLQLVHNKNNSQEETLQNTTENSELYENITLAILSAPEHNPSGFDLGYGEIREFALQSIERLSPSNCPDDRDQFIARLMMEGFKTPGGARFVNYALAS